MQEVISVGGEDKCSYIAVTKPFNPDKTRMKKITYTLMSLVILAAVSCSKEDDQIQPSSQSNASGQKVTYLSHIVPIERKACNASNCHNAINQNALSTQIMVAAAKSGELQMRLTGNSSCGTMDLSSVNLLQAWINTGATLE